MTLPNKGLEHWFPLNMCHVPGPHEFGDGIYYLMTLHGFKIGCLNSWMINVKNRLQAVIPQTIPFDGRLRSSGRYLTGHKAGRLGSSDSMDDGLHPQNGHLTQPQDIEMD